MRKPYIFIVSVIISILFFFIVFKGFSGVRNYLVGHFSSVYITPSPKDSLYMDLLNNYTKRDAAIQVANEVQGFYFVADSIKSVLDAKLDAELISDIIIDKGMANEMYHQLSKLDSSSIIDCIPICLDLRYKEEELWLDYFKQNSPSDIKIFVNEKLNLVMKAEKKALEAIKQN